MTYVPRQGDIVWLDFDPSSGKEIIKRRPAFVVSPKEFNAHTDLAIIAPITNTIRNIQLEVVLPDKLKTSGAVLVHQLKSMDYTARNATFIEHTPKHIRENVSRLAQLIVS